MLNVNDIKLYSIHEIQRDMNTVSLSTKIHAFDFPVILFGVKLHIEHANAVLHEMAPRQRNHTLPTLYNVMKLKNI